MYKKNRLISILIYDNDNMYTHAKDNKLTDSASKCSKALELSALSFCYRIRAVLSMQCATSRLVAALQLVSDFLTAVQCLRYMYGMCNMIGESKAVRRCSVGWVVSRYNLFHRKVNCERHSDFTQSAGGRTAGPHINTVDCLLLVDPSAVARQSARSAVY